MQHLVSMAPFRGGNCGRKRQPLAQTAPYLIGGRDTPKIFTATYNYTEKRYSRKFKFGKSTGSGTGCGSAAARGARPRPPCHRASRHSRHTYKCTRNNLLVKEKRSVLCYDTLDLPLPPTHFSRLFCCSPPRSDLTPPPPPTKRKKLDSPISRHTLFQPRHEADVDANSAADARAETEAARVSANVSANALRVRAAGCGEARAASRCRGLGSFSQRSNRFHQDQGRCSRGC
jgi:hypothetical protein